MILVTGATGHLGNAAIQSLLKKGVPAHEITALVRDENKAVHLKDQGIQIKIGNYNDYNSLKDALQGVDKLLLISSNDVADIRFCSIRTLSTPLRKMVFSTSFIRVMEIKIMRQQLFHSLFRFIKVQLIILKRPELPTLY
jgi:putative NADH-flavin reductase